MLKVKNIFKKFGSIEVLRGINLEISKNEIVSLVGSSGAGKSSLLQIIGTLDTPDEGTVEIFGQNPFALDEKNLAKFRNEHIGFIFQFHNLLAEFTVLENILMPAMISGKITEKHQKKAAELLDLLGIASKSANYPVQLSGGEQQRVAVARALINEPSLVLADEPSGNLDSANAKDLHELFFKLRTQLGQTFLIVTHNEELAHMADRRLVIQDGLVAG